MNMKVRLVVISIFVILFITYVKILIPREFNRTYHGVKYRLGDTNEEILDNVTIEFKGSMYKTLTLKNTFKGTISINDFKIPSEQSKEDYVVLDFGHKDWAMIQEFFPMNYFGDISLSKDRNRLSIIVMENRGWNGGDGLMISAPAINRKEALSISNELGNHYFNDLFTEFK